MYVPAHPATSTTAALRRLRYHVLQWGSAADASAARPPLVLLHGWMDVAASFQFMVDALRAAEGAPRWVIAPDWRGFGQTDVPPTDTYWFPDYLADLDALLEALVPFERFGPVDLLGHSMGGNVAMVYAGVRPARVRRLVNLEGFGMPQTQPEQAPGRLAKWLDELKTPATLRPYESMAAVAARLQQTNPRLPADKAAWLATQWAEPRAGVDGLTRWHLRADPAHKHVNPVLHHVEEVLAAWRRIGAPVLWVEGDLTDTAQWWGHRYPRTEFEARLAVVPELRRARLAPCGHMLHHDQPEALATELQRFLA